MNYELGLMILVFLEGLVILKALLELSRQLDDSMAEMDTNLATAIQTVVENLGIDRLVDPPNPIQNALAQLLTNSIASDSPGSLIEVSQGADGKFLKKE